jgi:cytochrome c biogenesis protein ResB
MRSPIKALRSIKLALALLAYFAITGIAASFIPQGREAAYYRETMSPSAAELVLKAGFTNFYGSLPFLIPAFAFFANLSSCAAYRFSRELLKDRKKRRHGPDILHLGLVLLVASVVAGQAAKQTSSEVQGYVRLGAGEAVQLSGGKILLVKSLREERYPDGRPRDWVSTVEIWKDGKLFVPEREIRVNRPLRIGGLSIRQASYRSERVLRLLGASGETRSLAGGENLDIDAGKVQLMSVDLQTKTAFARVEPRPVQGRDQGEAKIISVGIGTKLGNLAVVGMEEQALSGLMANYDPLFPLVVVSLLIAALGICLTFARSFLGGVIR